MRCYLSFKNINPVDIGHIIAKFLNEQWIFDYWYDYCDRGSKTHCIENNGKTLKCNHSIGACNCFFASFSYDMKPNSGIFKIKFNIDKITKSWANIFGIISQDGENNCKKISDNDSTVLKNSILIGILSINHDRYCWYSELYDYIGWSAFDQENNEYLPNGLFCGYDKTLNENIFRNKHYKNRLPGIDNGDIIILEYNSDLSKLTFSKENDNGKLNASIKNLPKEKTFFWFVGHECKEMSVTVV